MHLPHPDGWIVVERHVRDTTSRGTIIRAGLSERGAKAIAAQLNRDRLCGGYQHWAMPRADY